MHTSTAYLMELQPHRNQSPQDCVAEVCTHFSDFVLKYYRDRKRELLPLRFDGSSECPEEGTRLVAAHSVSAKHALATLDWEIIAAEDPHFIWRISLVCASDRQAVEVQYRVEVGLQSLLVSPGTRQMNLPTPLLAPVNLLSPLLGRWVAAVDGWPVPVAVQHLEANDIHAFVDRILLNPRRVLPVVLLAADGRFKATPNDMQELQRNLLGDAHVAALMSPAATKQLEALLGPERACSEGVLRIYHPLFTRDALPENHPLVFSKHLLGKGNLEHILHQEAQRIPVQRAPDGAVTKAARAAVCMELLKHTNQIPTLMTRLATAEDKLLSVEAQRDRLQEERDETRQSLRSSQGKLKEQGRTTSSQAEELLALRAKLGTCAQELAKLHTEHTSTLEQLHDREQALAQAQQHLQMVRDSLQAHTLPSAGGESEFEAELQRAWQENDQTLAELESARLELATLQGELAVCKENLELLTANPGSKRNVEVSAPPFTVSQPPRTVLEALRFASERFADVLDVWDDAWNSAKKSLYPGPTRVMKVLQAIAAVGRTYFAAMQEGQALGPLEQAFRAKIPFKYAPCESQMTMAIYGQERVFQGREIQRHFTLGGGGNCVQIYFEFDETSQKVIIAYCGQHLSHYRQR